MGDITAGSSLWPLTLTWQALADSLAAIGLEASPTSPIARFLPSRRSEAAERPAQELIPVLGLLARPRQALVVRVGDHSGQLSMFLSDGALVARFDRGSDGCIVSRPSGPDGFAVLVAGLAPKQPSSLPPVAITRTSFESLRQLRRIGLFAYEGQAVPLDDAARMIGEVARGRDPLEILDALERDEILMLDGGLVRAAPDRPRNHGPLVGPAVVSIRAAQCADSKADRSRDEALLVLGTNAAAVAYLPPHPDEQRLDTIVDVVPATAPVIAAAVQQLLAPPLAPPSTPTAECAHAPSLWLAPGPHDDASHDIPWRKDTLEDAAARSHLGGDDAPPAALLSPSATIEILARHGGVPVERHIFAMDERAAVEWTIRGSRLFWREHDAISLAGRVDRLTETSRATEGRWWVMRAQAQVDGAARVFEHVSDATRAFVVDGSSLPTIANGQLRRDICEAWRTSVEEAGR